MSVRPARVCLQVIPSEGSEMPDLAYTLQDVNYDRTLGPGMSCATFRLPSNISKGNYTFRLWYLPFDGNQPKQTGIPLGSEYLQNSSRAAADSWNGMESLLADGKIIARSYGFQNKTVKVELSVADVNDAHLLRDVLVQLQTRSAQGNKLKTDFNTQRTYSTSVLQMEKNAEPAEVDSKSVTCTFVLNEHYPDESGDQVFISIGTINEVFKNNFVEFRNQIEN